MKQLVTRVCAVATLALLGGCGNSHQLSPSEVYGAKPLPGRTVGLGAGDSLGSTLGRDREILALRARESNQPAFANIDGQSVPVGRED